MSLNQPFIPKGAGGQWVTCGASATLITAGKDSESMCFTAPIDNTGIAYVRCGFSDMPDATNADYPMLPGAQVSIGKFADHDSVSLVCPTGAAEVQVLPGIGI